MSERNEPGDEEERTDPSIELPDDGATLDHTMQVELPESRAARPPPLPGRSSPVRHATESPPPSERPPPSRPSPTSPPAKEAPPRRTAAAGDAPRSPSRDGTLPPRASEARPAPRTGTLPPPAFRPGSTPPSRMPKPSEPPPRSDLSPPQRQRLAQMEAQLDQARSALARQRHEMDELRSRLEAKEQRLEELLENLQSATSDDDIERRFAALEAQRDALAEELRKRFGDAEAAAGGTERFVSIETRLSSLEEGTELSRIRMRLERAGHRLDAVDGRIVELEGGQDALGDAVARAGRAEARVERLESLFEEMAQELRELRDARGDEELRARVADLETLVLETGTNEKALRQRLEEQTDRIRKLSESIVPPARAPSPSGDDLTRIKGVGPKFATALAEMGVTEIAEIAAWGDDDVQRAATTLGIKASRVARWVKAAQAV